MIMHTTHYLNFGTIAALLGRTKGKTKSCPYCHAKLPDCDCGYGQLLLDRHDPIPVAAKPTATAGTIPETFR